MICSCLCLPQRIKTVSGGIDATKGTESRIQSISGEDSIFMERRRELAFEAQVFYDYTRNGIKLSREEVTTVYPDYIGHQYNEIDPLSSRRIVFLIPSEELKLNPELEQNTY